MSYTRRHFLWQAALAAPVLGAAAEAVGGALEGGFPSHAAIGHGFGIAPGRVAWAHDPNSVRWDGKGFWWASEHFDEKAIGRMLLRTLESVTNRQGAGAALKALFEDFNLRHEGRLRGYRAGEKIAIKVNMNGAGAYGSEHPEATHESYGNAVLIRALLYSLVQEAGIEPGLITVYDAGRLFPEPMQAFCREGGLQAVRFAHRRPGLADDARPDRLAPLIWSSSVRGEKSYLPLCVTQAHYLINLANLKGHCYGLTLCAKNHFGSFVNSERMRAPQQAGLHGNVSSAAMGDYSVLTDLIANRHLGGKTLLYLLDGLLTATGESVALTAEAARWSMPPFNGGFCASLFASQDPVAIDSVGADFLMNEPNMLRRNPVLRGNVGVHNYLHEAALADKAPSGVAYRDGNGRRVASLGVHEHWNDAEHKQYSGNLGRAGGIELVRV